MAIKIYHHDTPEYERLLMAAALMNHNSPRGYHYTVGVTYFDFGLNWEWTTIICDGGNFGGYQALSPREHEKIVTAETIMDIKAAVIEVFSDKSCPDRIEGR